MDASFTQPIEQRADGGKLRRERSPVVGALVCWQRLVDVGAALVLTADARLDHALVALPPLLDRLTRPHRILEVLDAETKGVLCGDQLAARRLRDLLAAIAHSYPELIGSTVRAQARIEGQELRPHVGKRARIGDDGMLVQDRDAQLGDANILDLYRRNNMEDAETIDQHSPHTDAHDATLDFDGVVRLATAAALATRSGPPAELDAALDVVTGLVMLTSAADSLARGLEHGGASGVAEEFNILRLLGHWVTFAPPPMRVMSGNLAMPDGGFPGLPGKGMPSLPGGPRGPEDIPGLAKKTIDRLRERRHWDPELWDSGVPWRTIVGLDPVEVIDRAEIRRIRCLLALEHALMLRQEPPPQAPARVVWYDTIAIITPPTACPGERIFIQGGDFGAPDTGIGVLLPMADGSYAFEVQAADWTQDTITITLSPGIISGPVGLVSLTYVRAYDNWANRMNELAKAIIENAECARTKAPDVTYVPLFRTCLPDRAANHLPTTPADLAAAPLRTWHTGQDIDSVDVVETLLDHIDDQHYCKFSEWLFPWEDDCPDNDGAVWVGILPRDPVIGLTRRLSIFNLPVVRSTVIVSTSKETCVSRQRQLRRASRRRCEAETLSFASVLPSFAPAITPGCFGL